MLLFIMSTQKPPKQFKAVFQLKLIKRDLQFLAKNLGYFIQSFYGKILLSAFQPAHIALRSAYFLGQFGLSHAFFLAQQQKIIKNLHLLAVEIVPFFKLWIL